jgi:ribosomal protein S30
LVVRRERLIYKLFARFSVVPFSAAIRNEIGKIQAKERFNESRRRYRRLHQKRHIVESSTYPPLLRRAVS